MKFKSIAAAFLGICISLTTTFAEARQSVPIVNHENVIVATGSGKPVTAAQFKQAIVNGAANKNWGLAAQGDGSYLATLVVRGKHTLVAKVSYGGDKYSVVYNSSNNLNYFVNDEGVATIHPNSNLWLRELKDAIRQELLKY